MALACSSKACHAASHRAHASAASRSALWVRRPAVGLQRRRAAPEDGGEDLSGLLKDLERFQQRAGPGTAPAPGGPGIATKPGPGGAPSSSGAAGAGDEPSPFKEALDKVLIADFFFVLIILGWLAAGLGVQGVLHSSALLDAWFPLWPLVFQPAIGVLMLGALVSGGLGWLKEQEAKKGA